MQTYKILPCHEPDLASVYLLEIVEDILQHLSIGETASIGLAKKFSDNLLKYMRHVLGIENANRDINLLKRFLCDQFRRIAETHTQLDVSIITYCIEEINRNNSTILAELAGESERVVFLDNLENICSKYIDDLTINAYLNNVLMPSNISQEIPLDIDQNITLINIDYNNNSAISEIEAGCIHSIRTAFYFHRLGGRESLLKAIAIYTGTMAHFENFRSLSLNYSLIAANIRYNVLQAIHDFTLTLSRDAIEELIIYHKKMLQQSLRLENFPVIMNQMIAEQRDCFRRLLVNTLTRFTFSKQFSYRKMVKGLLEIIALQDEIQQKTPSDVFENRCSLTTLALINLQYGIYIANNFSNFQDAERRLLLANQYNAKAYLGISRDFSLQPLFAVRQAFLVFSIMGSMSLEKRSYYLQACEDEFAWIPEHQSNQEMHCAIAVIRRNNAVVRIVMGKQYNSNSSKEDLLKAKKIFTSVLVKMDMIKPPHRLPIDDELQRFSFLYYGIACAAYLLKTNAITSKEHRDELFLAISNCNVSRALNEQPSVHYYDALQSFIRLLSELADRVANFADSYFALKVTVQALIMNNYLCAADLSIEQEDLQKLQTQLLKFTYQYVFSIEETYEKVLPENLNVILDAVAHFESIKPASLSALRKFHYTSIQMELKKLIIACEDLMSIRLKDLQKDYSFEHCFFKSRSINEKELFVNNNEIINRVKHKNVFPLFKKIMNHWIEIKGGLNTDNEQEVLKDVDYVRRLEELLKAFERRERTQNTTEVSAMENNSEAGREERPRRYSF